jgi:hypothetical protein
MEWNNTVDKLKFLDIFDNKDNHNRLYYMLWLNALEPWTITRYYKLATLPPKMIYENPFGV